MSSSTGAAELASIDGGATQPPSQPRTAQSQHLRNFVTGGLASMSASSITHPIDVVKVRLTLHGQGQRGATLSVAQAVRSQPLHTLYRGLTAAWLRQATYASTRFGVYGGLQAAAATSPVEMPAWRRLVNMIGAGATAALVTCPAETVLVRMQADANAPPAQRRNYRNVFDGLRKTLRYEGLRGLYGTAPSLMVRGATMAVAQFSAYEVLKAQLMQYTSLGDTTRTHLISGVGSGLSASLVTMPLDVVKSRLMNADTRQSTVPPCTANNKGSTAGQNGAPARYRGGLDCAMQTVRAEGVRGLYKGLLPYSARLVPQTVLIWFFLEKYRAAWDTYVHN